MAFSNLTRKSKNNNRLGSLKREASEGFTGVPGIPKDHDNKLPTSQMGRGRDSGGRLHSSVKKDS